VCIVTSFMNPRLRIENAEDVGEICRLGMRAGATSKVCSLRACSRVWVLFGNRLGGGGI
jgi:hypothetical protein